MLQSVRLVAVQSPQMAVRVSQDERHRLVSETKTLTQNGQNWFQFPMLWLSLFPAKCCEACVTVIAQARRQYPHWTHAQSKQMEPVGAKRSVHSHWMQANIANLRAKLDRQQVLLFQWRTFVRCSASCVKVNVCGVKRTKGIWRRVRVGGKSNGRPTHVLPNCLYS